MWNELIKIRDNKKTPADVKKQAELYLRQLNTASGSVLLKEETAHFVSANKRYLI